MCIYAASFKKGHAEVLFCGVAFCVRKSVKISIINTAGDMLRERGNIGGTHYYDAQDNDYYDAQNIEQDENYTKEKYGLYNSAENAGKL